MKIKIRQKGKDKNKETFKKYGKYTSKHVRLAAAAKTHTQPPTHSSKPKNV